MITQSDFNSIEQYLSGQLTDSELQVFLQQMEADESFAEAVFLQEQIKIEWTDTGFQNFKETLQGVEETYHASDNQTVLDKSQKQDTTLNKGVYTLEELLAFFRPVNHYEKAISEAELAGVVRANELGIVTPENGADCSENIVFQLKSPVTESIKIIIENSEEDIVKRGELQAGKTQLNIDTSDLRPGRYYWKIKSRQHGTTLGMFFVQKNWMPEVGI